MHQYLLVNAVLLKILHLIVNATIVIIAVATAYN